MNVSMVRCNDCEEEWVEGDEENGDDECFNCGGTHLTFFETDFENLENEDIENETTSSL